MQVNIAPVAALFAGQHSYADEPLVGGSASLPIEYFSNHICVSQCSIDYETSDHL